MVRQRAEERWSQVPIDEVFARLEATREGLTSAEASRRLAEFGKNELPTEERPLPLVIFLRQVRSPLVYVLVAAGLVSLALGKYVDATFIAIIVVLNAVVGFLQEYKAEQSIQALARMTAPKARVLRDGEDVEVYPNVLVPGDVVLLESGFKVPADLRLFRVSDLQADEAILTGESLPVAKTTESIAALTMPRDSADMAFMGTSIVRGRGAGVVVATGARTSLGSIASEMRQIGEVEAPFQARLAQFALYLGYATVGLTALVFLLGVLRGEDVTEIFLTAIAVAVAVIPEGLPITVTMALAVGVWRMAKRNAIMRRLAAVETLGSCTTICSDKTGTLTTNQMTVTNVWAGGKLFEVTGVGYIPQGSILLDSHPATPAAHPPLLLTLRTGLLCNASSLYEEGGRFHIDGDPTEGALIVAARKAGLEEERESDAYPQLYEIPFSSEQQYMATLNAHGNERFAFVKGAPERILEMCDRMYLDNSASPLHPEFLLDEFYRLASQGLRVLAMAFKPVPPRTREIGPGDVEHGLTFVGFQGMIDPPRPEAIPAVGDTQRAGVRVLMVTGDHRVTARAIAYRLGIIATPDAPVIDGRELEQMGEAELARRVEEVAVYARVAPLQKLHIVQQLRQQGEIVAVTGDGVNDAPALKQADIGVAMGITGTDVAKEAADMVVADDNFATIYVALEEGRVVFDNVRKVILFLIPTGLGLVGAVLTSMVLGLPLPFLPIQAIWINLVTNGTQDIAMAFEPAEEDVGRRSPRNPREGILTPWMIQRTILVGAVIAIGTLGAFSWQLGSGGGLVLPRTVAMTTMVLFQNFYIFTVRSFHRYFFQVNPLTNRFLFVSIVAALGIHVLALYWGPLQFVLHTEPVSLSTWLVMIAIASTVLLVSVAEKALRRVWDR